jgi:peptide/nickel transport system ATP-binding protein
VAERGMALMLISHDLGVIAQNVQRMLVMYGGSVVESGPTGRVRQSRASLHAGPVRGAAGLRAPRGRLATIRARCPSWWTCRGLPVRRACSFTIPECHVTAAAGGEVEPDHAGRVHPAGCRRRGAAPPPQPSPRRGGRKSA